MKLFLALFFSLAFSIPQGFACNIGDRELRLRMTLMQFTRPEFYTLAASEAQNELPETGLTKREFQRLIDSVKRVYAPIFKKQRMNFRIESQWDDKQVNAFAGVRGFDRFILLYGGYARHPLMTKDAFLSVICHEIGHHLGGFPKKSNNTWSSSEGQADYYSTLKCMKTVLRNDGQNEKLAQETELPEEIKKQCRHQHPKDNDYFICLRSSKAAEIHSRIIAEVGTEGGRNSEVSLLTPSPEKMLVTNLKYPDAQCRLDTKLQGALCNAPVSVPLDNDDETAGTCHYNNFNIIGNRPVCWFVHKK